MDTYKIKPEQYERLCSKEKITLDDITSLMQSFSQGKIKKQEIGSFRIKNEYVPMLKESALMTYEGGFVFSAIEKCKSSLFSKAAYRLFVWPILSDTIYAVPVPSLIFDFNLKRYKEVKKPVYETKVYGVYPDITRVQGNFLYYDCYSVPYTPWQEAYIKTEECERQIEFTFHYAGSHYYDRHKIKVYACQLFRKFEMRKKYIEAVSDIVKYMMINDEGFECSGERYYAPMYALRNNIVPEEGAIM